MTSYNENKSTSSFSRNIILVDSNHWKTDENLDQNNSTPSSLIEEEEDNSKVRQLYIFKYLGHQIHLVKKMKKTVKMKKMLKMWSRIII